MNEHSAGYLTNGYANIFLEEDIKFTRVFLVVMILLFIAGILFAGGRQSSQPSGGGVVLNYPHYTVGTHLGRPAWEAFYARFSEKYKGQITLKMVNLSTAMLENMQKMNKENGQAGKTVG